MVERNKNILLIITPDQFGYHTDDYYRAYYANNDYEVHVMCYDHGKLRIELQGIFIHYIKYGKNRISNEINLNRILKKRISSMDIRVIYTRFFISCAIFRILNFRKNIKWILDIRTGSVSGSSKKRYIYNTLIRLSSKFYRNITIISEGLAKELRIKNYFIIPLGGQPLVQQNEIMNLSNAMNFLYIGILDGRNFDIAIRAYCRFYREYSSLISTKLTIIGYSNDPYYEKCIANIIENNPDVLIDFVGRIPNMELKKYLIDSNIGISFIPITKWFDVQPPTKTFEYIVNGLFCLATATNENRKVITADNGILVLDSEESVYQGMNKIFEIRNDVDRNKIFKEADRYTWENIYKNNIKNLFSF